jgi:hypothetical protein
LRCFADRFGIDRVVLLPLRERFYVGGRVGSSRRFS